MHTLTACPSPSTPPTSVTRRPQPLTLTSHPHSPTQP
ncbi:hypothetical protein E2C01_079783 [Portunus trituberculatus]|uniref:Uncharacterized protein n=1 Tax=Portunus trituberculatus TaxID=210409 RepID=A0A5B7IRF6_PORTR|nr:hypothetical protein [Portunus trituberculatus]